ncbi:energy transducer TonB [Qipengyuania nanhaisediminis]|uniref:Cell division and transport-associated protein TolA n=1 Tax=Qipengyuania nanhaisediminis TaxID=604088 RepID=A0A1I5LCY7_9SPHN|nr:energy transducer TonB [Qipengyuania nanhaisediminis]SFO95108.1 Cell division and transport-associated protein TolA [Qipengyuania nanhaisediminis]
MERTGIRTEERTGLLIAIGLHLALLAALLVQALMPAAEIPQTERMTVSLAEDVGLEATAPEPVPESRAAIAPELSDSPAPAPEMLEAPDTPQVDRPTPQVQPNPAPARETRPQPRREQPREQAQPRRTERSGGSRVGDNFLAGAGDSTTTNETRVPASQIGASAKASLVQRISREIKPHWQPPSGPEVEQITTFLRFQLNPDGSLAGRPTVVRQTGVNDTNRAQAGRHGEQAIRAVQLAAPFELPEEYYEAWKVVGPFGFDWRLAQ